MLRVYAHTLALDEFQIEHISSSGEIQIYT